MDWIGLDWMDWIGLSTTNGLDGKYVNHGLSASQGHVEVKGSQRNMMSLIEDYLGLGHWHDLKVSL